MGGDWKETTLGECAQWLSGGTPFKGNEAFWTGSIPWVSAKDMKSFRLHDAEDHISPLAVGNGGKLVPAGTILLLVRGMTLHNDVPICMVMREMAFNQDIKALLPAKDVDGAFLAYWLLANKPELLASVDHAGHGTGRLVTDTLKEKPVQLPPLPEQKAIASVLGALDDKIELNRRMNATLEAMARTLFQSWFVDFDPVRAKLDGRQPGGMDKATAALFPDSFQDSELGLIPKGWRATTLGNECERGGGSIQTGPFGTQLHASDYVDEGVPSIMPSDLRDNRIEITELARIHESDAERLNAYRVKPGDVVYSRRGDVERRSLIRHAEAGWLCGTGCLRVRFGANGLNPFFGASYLGSEDSRAWVVRHAVGATMPNLNTSILGALPMICPPPALQACFAETVGQWDERGTIALHQSRTLATLRDTLLPKLLSGELSLREVNTANEGAV
jgi:type I restriction enzyme S subunit